MQNQIVGEKLKGLNESFEQLVFKKSGETILTEKIMMIVNEIKEFFLNFRDLENKLHNSASQNTSLWNDLKEMQNFKLDLQNQITKLTSKAKERFNYLNEDIKSLRQEKEKMRAQLETSEKKILAITEDYEHLKAKMKQLKLKKSLDDNTKDEKLCLICKNLYKESENFNWSCKTHLSLYSGDVW